MDMEIMMNAGEVVILKRYWILTSSSRVCACGRGLFLIPWRYSFSAEQILLIYTPSRSIFTLLFDVRLESNIWIFIIAVVIYSFYSNTTGVLEVFTKVQ